MADSISDFLFNGNPPSSFTSPISATSTMPDWWQSAAQGLISRASQLAAQPYPTYPGPQVAPIDPLTQKAYNGADSMMPAATGDINSAGSMLGTAGTLFDPNQFSQFMNPYTSNVVNDIATLGNRNLMENILPQVNDTFTKSGQFGSNRNADFTNRAIRDEEQVIAQQQDQALNQGFQSSMSNYQNGQNNLANTGSKLGALGSLAQQTGAAQTNLDTNLGQIQQGNQQQNLNTAQNNFNNQFNYPLQMLGMMSQVIKGYQPNPTTFGYQSSQLNNTGQQQSPLQLLPTMISGVAGGQPNGLSIG